MESKTFQDFHDHGASAPEWNQRYHQLSSGLMHSSLLEVSFSHVHLFRKSLSQRVVQQGCLPRGKVCFAVPTSVAGPARMQGRDVSTNSLFILRSGDEFTIHRPKGMELLALTFDSDRLEHFLDASGAESLARWALPHPVIDLPAESLEQLRTTMRAVLSGVLVSGSGALDAVGGAEASLEIMLFATLTALLREPLVGRAQPSRRSSASYVVEESHRMAMAADGSALTVEDICRRLRASRRTVQSSFNVVAETTPVRYMPSLRLNAVRRQLLTTSAEDVGVGQVAAGWGFAHLGHFASEYRALFGELPSETQRAVAVAAH